MTDEAKALVEELRKRRVYKDGVRRQPRKHEREAADLIETQAREIERLREALVAEREENLWSAYAAGDVRGDEWTHLYMSDGEWLVRQCGLDPKQGYYKAEQIRNAIPIAARAALAGDSHD